MTVNPGITSFDGSAEWEKVVKTREALTRSYIASYRGPQGDAPHIDRGLTGPVQLRALRLVSPELLAAHRRLGLRRRPGETIVASYGEEDPGGFGPALQLVTDDTPMLMDPVTVLLSRVGLA